MSIIIFTVLTAIEYLFTYTEIRQPSLFTTTFTVAFLDLQLVLVYLADTSITYQFVCLCLMFDISHQVVFIFKDFLNISIIRFIYKLGLQLNPIIIYTVSEILSELFQTHMLVYFVDIDLVSRY